MRTNNPTNLYHMDSYGPMFFFPHSGGPGGHRRLHPHPSPSRVPTRWVAPAPHRRDPFGGATDTAGIGGLVRRSIWGGTASRLWERPKPSAFSVGEKEKKRRQKLLVLAGPASIEQKPHDSW